MTRVSTFQQSQTLLMEMLNSQAKVEKAQKQVTTGHVAEFYKDIYQDTAGLTGAKSLLSRLEQHKENDAIVQAELSAYDQALAGMESAATDLKEAVMGAINASSALGFEAAVEGVFEAVLGFMNSQNTEGYLFAGSKKDTAPINITQFSDLLTALEPPTDIYTNDTLKRSVKIDENRTIETGMLADELSFDIMTALQRIALWQNGTIPTTAPVPAGPAGPITTPLRTEDQDFLIAEISNLETLVRDLNEARGQNGLNQRLVTQTVESIDVQITQTKIYISNIEDVDSAEAIVNLNQANFALEASYNVLSQINRTSLLNFLG
ncbi:flagellin [Sneathiella glossodoripedis]|uniref:flagellin n=1 Tax=Sneathiella glossodoripedis TaxID=418853 RepID=UPI00046F05E6|nr:flagellin [Sneathiella glossodoripedis]